METLILVIHIIVAVALILFILLQSGKGGGVSAAFGGGAGAALGQRSAGTVLGKLTVILSITFGVTSMSLAILSTEDKTTSGYETPTDNKPVNTQTPVAPAPTADSNTEESDPSTKQTETEPATPKTEGTTENAAPAGTAPDQKDAPAEIEKANAPEQQGQNTDSAKPAEQKDPSEAAE